MGVIFQNGIGIGTIPSSFGGSGQWLLQVGGLGYSPAWDDGSITFPMHDSNSGSNDPTDLFTHPGGLYINGKDSSGADKSVILGSMVGHSGTLTLTQGSTQVVFGFSNGSFYDNTYGNVNGAEHENGANVPLTLISSQNLPFTGFNGGGTPNNSQLITVTVNII